MSGKNHRRLAQLLVGAGCCVCLGWSQAAQSAAERKSEAHRTIDLLLADDELTPAQLTLEEGRYQFRVHNAFTEAALTLRIDDDKNNRVKDAAGKPFAGRAVLVEKLKPGRYVLWVPQRPKWRVDVVVAEKK